MCDGVSDSKSFVHSTPILKNRIGDALGMSGVLTTLHIVSAIDRLGVWISENYVFKSFPIDFTLIFPIH